MRTAERRNSWARDDGGRTMCAPLVIERPALSDPARLSVLVVAVPVLAFGLLCAFRVAAALARPGTPENLWLGVALAVAPLALGALCLFGAFKPHLRATFDPGRGQVHLRFAYPFGLRQERTFPLSQIGVPEAAWVRDADHLAGGYWEVRIAMPDGFVVRRACPGGPPSDRRAEALAWRDAIAAMRVPEGEGRP